MTIKFWNTDSAIMAKYGDDTYQMLDVGRTAERSILLYQAQQTGFKDGGNWITPYSEKLWSKVKKLGTLLAIRVGYKRRFQATFFFYDGLGIKISDNDLCNQTDDIFQKVDELGTLTGVGTSVVPYSKELWDALLVTGEVVG